MQKLADFKATLIILAGSAWILGPADARSEPKPLRPQAVLTCDSWKAGRIKAPPGPVLAPLHKGVFTPVPLDSVQVVDKTIRRKVMVQSLAARRTETDTVEVMARLVNCTDKPLQVQARTSFLTDGQTASEPTSSWRRVFLQPRSMGAYSEKSMSTQVAHYLVELRHGD